MSQLQRRQLAAVAAVAMVGISVAGCSRSEGTHAAPTPTTSSAAAPAPIPASPVQADNKASEDAFAGKVTSDPCQSDLVAAALGILQRGAQKAQTPWSNITVTASKGVSLTGIPQCNLQVSNVSAIASVSIAAVTADTNQKPTGTLAIGDLVRAADPTVTSRVVVEPACTITQEFLGRLQTTGLAAAWVTDTRPLDDTVQVSAVDPSITVAKWKGHVVRAQRRCADTRTTSGRPGDSPDWIIAVDAPTTLTNAEEARTIQTDVATHLGQWVSGQPLKF